MAFRHRLLSLEQRVWITISLLPLNGSTSTYGRRSNGELTQPPDGAPDEYDGRFRTCRSSTVQPCEADGHFPLREGTDSGS
jgi:hypothetical protein